MAKHLVKSYILMTKALPNTLFLFNIKYLVLRLRKRNIFILLGLFLLLRPSQVSADNNNILSNSWNLAGNNGDAQAYQSVDKNILQGKNSLQITYNLHGICLLTGDASALIFDQNG